MTSTVTKPSAMAAATASPPLPTGIWNALGLPESRYGMTTPPQSVSSSDLARALEVAVAELEPCTADDLNAAVLVLAGLPSARMDEVTTHSVRIGFQMGLSDVPADLLRKAIVEACRTCEWRPAPGKVRGFIADELEMRRVRLERLRAAL